MSTQRTSNHDHEIQSFSGRFYSQFKAFQELMQIKVQRILLVSSAYDAYIMEEDGSLASKIINEYSGLNLSRPPVIIRTASAATGLDLIRNQEFDLVITMPYLDEMDAFELGIRIKDIKPELPVILLGHSPRGIYPIPEDRDTRGIDDIYFWTGNSDLLLALVKSTEDRMNVEHDTRRAMVRVLLFVEDNPIYRSTLLPFLYKEIVGQIQKVLVTGLNEEHRLLRMRARPKILLAATFEEALALYSKYKDYLFGVISDTRMPREGRMDPDAGVCLLSEIKSEIEDLPLLLMSNEPSNKQRSECIPAVFLNKNSPYLMNELHDFFLNHLGFGDFVFRMPDGREVGRASNLRTLEAMLKEIPAESLYYHASRNHFSNWIMGRSEVVLASAFRKVSASTFSDTEEIRDYLVRNIHKLRKLRQKGVIAQFRERNFDPDVMDFVKIGDGSIGGKARGLAFMSAMISQQAWLHQQHPDVEIRIPKILVITTEGFEAFITANHLKYLSKGGYTDKQIAQAFLNAEMPRWLLAKLRFFLQHVDYPLSIRSSSLLEDAQFQPYAGLYETYMIPNNHPDLSVRLKHLVTAVKLVYASTYYEGPLAFSRLVSSPQEESMAVIIQQLAGTQYGDFFYPEISGVAQSHNFYPISHMKAEDGIAQIAMGFGRTVVQGERSLRFCPKYPHILPQFSTIDEILENAQRYFYALRVQGYPETLHFDKDANLEKLDVDDAESDSSMAFVASTYIPEEHRIRDTAHGPGYKVLTFAPVLKHELFPLACLLGDLVDIGRKGMGCPVEIEFSVTLANATPTRKGTFNFLQIRPMAFGTQAGQITITDADRRRAFCRSAQALGNGQSASIQDIVYVRLDTFTNQVTVEIASEIGRINSELVRDNRPYLLIGPGRWGSADRFLGIPVQWQQISGVGAIIELRNESLKVEASQGSHFFQNITSLGIPYITVTEGAGDQFDWRWLNGLSAETETNYLRHVRLQKPLTIKISVRDSECVILAN